MSLYVKVCYDFNYVFQLIRVIFIIDCVRFHHILKVDEMIGCYYCLNDSTYVIDILENICESFDDCTNNQTMKDLSCQVISSSSYNYS